MRAQAHEAMLWRLIRAGLLLHPRVGAGRKAVRILASWLDASLGALATPIEARR